MATTKMLLPVLLSLSGITCNTPEVYVCDSKTATRYHYNEHCRGLKNCNYSIRKTTLINAENSGKTRCRWEK